MEEEWRGGFFEANGHQIIPLFDVPRLLKRNRNNLILRNSAHVIDGRSLTAKWQHIEKLYETDC